MKRKMLKLASIAMITAGLAGTALAQPYLPGTPGDDTTAMPGSQDMTACHESADKATAQLSPEAPWVSLALANTERLGLVAEQVRQLEELRAGFGREALRATRTIADAERALRELLIAQPVDLARVGEQLDEVGRLRDDLRLRRIETLLAGRAVLSAEQLAVLQALLARSAEAMHGAMMDGDPDRGAPAPSAGVM